VTLAKLQRQLSDSMNSSPIMSTNLREKDEYSTFGVVVQKKPVSFNLKAKAVLFGFLLLAIGALFGLKAGQAMGKPLQLTDVPEAEGFGFGKKCTGVVCDGDNMICNPLNGECQLSGSSGVMGMSSGFRSEANVAEAEGFGFGTKCTGVVCDGDNMICNPLNGECQLSGSSGVMGMSSGFRSEANVAEAEGFGFGTKCTGVVCDGDNMICNPLNGECQLSGSNGVMGMSSGFRSEANVAEAEGFGFGKKCTGVVCDGDNMICNRLNGECQLSGSSGVMGMSSGF